MAARGLTHWSCMMAIWRASLCLYECAHVGVCEEACCQVCSPWASSACITATPVTAAPCTSCGLWACAQQSRLTVVPPGTTNYLSCPIHARNSWMRTAALIRKNFHRWATHLSYEIWHTFRVYSILLFQWHNFSHVIIGRNAACKCLRITFASFQEFDEWLILKGKHLDAAAAA